MKILPYVLILIGWPITSLIVNYIRHRPRYRAPGFGTQHIVLAGLLAKVVFIGSGIGLLLAGVF